MFHEFTAASTKHGPEHAFALAQAGVLALFVLDVDIEGFAFKEKLQVTVVLQNGMCSRLVEHAFQSSPPQVLIWEFPERYLPAHNDLKEFDPKWIAELKKAGESQHNLALNDKSPESPTQAQN